MIEAYKNADKVEGTGVDMGFIGSGEGQFWDRFWILNWGRKSFHIQGGPTARTVDTAATSI